MEKVVVIMPTYKEAENIGDMIEALFEKEFPKIKKAQMNLLVVNDLDEEGKDDGTGDIVRKYQKKYKNLHLIEGKKEGLGYAYVKGMKHAMDKLKADAVVEMDADGQHPPRFIKPMVDAYLKGAGYVIGSRYIKGGSIPKEWAFFRKAVSYFGNLFIRLVLLKPSIHDLTTGFRLTKVKGVLDKINLDNLMALDRFAYKVDLLYQSIKNAIKVKEVPLEFAPRKKEKSKLVGSPACLPGIGIKRAVSGLSSRRASEAKSSSKGVSCSGEVSPGRGIVSSPVPQTAEYSSKSLTDSSPSAALSARAESSSRGNSSPLKPTRLNSA
jgi:dolichol-phosphate mannosyltransferase